MADDLLKNVIIDNAQLSDKNLFFDVIIQNSFPQIQDAFMQLCNPVLAILNAVDFNFWVHISSQQVHCFENKFFSYMFTVEIKKMHLVGLIHHTSSSVSCHVNFLLALEQ